MKCASTSLHHYLDLHPEISMCRERGLNFFLEEYNWGRGVDWYASQFPGSAPWRGDTSPRYSNFPINAGAPQRMHAVIPNAKLIYIVRDPVERILSHHTHYLAHRREDRSLARALADRPGGDIRRNPYVCRSLYFLQLEQYLQFYPRSQICVVYFEELRDSPCRALQSLFRFMGVDDSFESSGFRIVHHPTRQKRRATRTGAAVERFVAASPIRWLRQDTRDRVKRVLTLPFSHAVTRPVLGPEIEGDLRELLSADAQRLRDFVGRSCPAWSL